MSLTPWLVLTLGDRRAGKASLLDAAAYRILERYRDRAAVSAGRGSADLCDPGSGFWSDDEIAPLAGADSRETVLRGLWRRWLGLDRRERRGHPTPFGRERWRFHGWTFAQPEPDAPPRRIIAASVGMDAVGAWMRRAELAPSSEAWLAAGRVDAALRQASRLVIAINPSDQLETATVSAFCAAIDRLKPDAEIRFVATAIDDFIADAFLEARHDIADPLDALRRAVAPARDHSLFKQLTAARLELSEPIARAGGAARFACASAFGYLRNSRILNVDVLRPSRPLWPNANSDVNWPLPTATPGLGGWLPVGAAEALFDIDCTA